MKHFFKGKWIELSKTNELLESLGKEVIKSLEIDLKIQDVLDACDKFSKKLIQDKLMRARLGKELSEESFLDDVSAFCSKENLLKKIKKELGGLDSYDLKKQSFKEAIFESYSPIGTLVHITPSNSEGLSFFAVIEGLLGLNNNLVKISSKDGLFTGMALEELIECDESYKINSKVGVFSISSSEQGQLRKLLCVADGVSCWGGESAIESIKKMTPQGARFIPWGHKISFGYVDSANLNNDKVLDKISFEIVNNEQQACSSPQVLFLETDSYEKCVEFSKRLFKILEIESNKKELADLDIQTQAEITNEVELARLEAPMDIAMVLEPKNKGFRIIVEKNPALRPSPLYRTIIVKPLLIDKIIEVLHPWRAYLQTVGLCAKREIGASLSKKFIAAGVVRITKIGEMVSSYAGEPHDGVYALTRFMKRVRVDLDEVSDIHRLSDFNFFSLKQKKENAEKVMTKLDFQKMAESGIDQAELLFKSGGSTGKSALSLFSYSDYHDQMKNAAEGLFAAGLDPKEDRVMNLFFGGGLYGGFVSFFTILEKLEAVQLPMAAHEDHKMVGEMIVSSKVNTLVGMPSYIIQVIKTNLKLFKKYGKLTKIFYAGEHFSNDQKAWLRAELGLEIIRSAAYGSVDAGPLGFQCPSCEGQIHHLLENNQSLEILELDSDKHCPAGVTGRLIFTSKNRDVLKLKRYDIGDLGCWVEGACKCGRGTPRFELQGRRGDIFRAGGTFINLKKIELALSEKFNYSGEIQILIEQVLGRDQVTLYLDALFIKEKVEFIKESILCDYRELFEANVKEKVLDFFVMKKKGKDFQRTKASGKLKRVLDERRN